MTTLGMTVWLIASSAVAGIPAGEPILDAVVVDLTRDGLDAVGDIGLGFVPARIDLPGFASGDPDASDWTCLFNDPYFGLFGAYVDIEVTSLLLTPGGAGALELEAELLLSVNSLKSPMLVEYDAFCFEGACDSYVEPFPLSASATIDFLDVKDKKSGEVSLSPQITGLLVDYVVDEDALIFNDCSLETLLGIADFFGISVTDLILQEVDALIADVESQLDPLNQELVGILSDLNIEEELELGEGVVLDVGVGLAAVSSDIDGIRLHLDGWSAASVVDPCIQPYDSGESVETPSDPPLIGEVAVFEEFGPAHLGAFIKDDFANQLLYAAWQTGLLCQTVDEELLGDGLPLAFDTSLLPLLMGDAFSHLFEERQPIMMLTRPEAPPVLDLTDGEIAARIDDMALAVISEVEGRQVRLVDVSLDMVVGVPLAFDGDTGVLSILLDLSRGVAADVNHNDYAPDRDNDITGQLAGLFEQPLITGLLGTALSDLALGIPSIPLGKDLLGLQALELETAGPSEDWIGGYAWVGPVPYETAETGCGCDDKASGCDDSKGCESAKGCEEGKGCDKDSLFKTKGCDSKDPAGTEDCGSCEGGGCSMTGPLGGRALVVAFAVVLAGLRRRRRSA